jgi:hypothetical protein
MDQVSHDVENSDVKPASGRSKEAEELLDTTLQQIHQQLITHKINLALEQQARFEDAIKHVRRQEERIEAETKELAALERSGPLSRAQVFGLLELARQQTLLQEESDRIAQSLAAANVFRLGLSAASAQMHRAAGFLRDQQTGSATQQAEQAAIARLGLLVTALEPESNDGAKPDGNAGNGGAAGQGNAGGVNAGGQLGGPAMLAEVKFLKLWQEDLNRRTQQLEMDAARTPPEELRERHAELADEQARLAAAALRLRNPQKTDADAPDAGPDERKEN